MTTTAPSVNPVGIPSTAAHVRALRDAISPGRFATYVRRTHTNARRGLVLYAWNIRASAALYPVLQVNEVTLRNTIDRALSSQFGPAWPYSRGFLRTLPQHARTTFEKERNKLERRRGTRRLTTGDVVASQTYWFWTLLLTRRFQKRIWSAEFARSFPYAPPRVGLNTVRERAEAIREIRNRIAHHEPLMNHDLPGVYNRAISIVRWIAPTKAQWAAERWPLATPSLRHP